jgi:hypothetical protein
MVKPAKSFPICFCARERSRFDPIGVPRLPDVSRIWVQLLGQRSFFADNPCPADHRGLSVELDPEPERGALRDVRRLDRVL